MDETSSAVCSLFSAPLKYHRTKTLDIRYTADEKLNIRRSFRARGRSVKENGGGVDEDVNVDPVEAEQIERAREMRAFSVLSSQVARGQGDAQRGLTPASSFSRTKRQTSTTDGEIDAHPGSDEEDSPVRPRNSRKGPRSQSHISILRSHNLTAQPQVPFHLRTRHISVLSAILQKSLMARDFPRAKRAFFLLLTEKTNQSQLVSLKRIWQIGTEVLVRSDGGDGAGLRKAIEYLNRLILVYPAKANSIPPLRETKFKRTDTKKQKKTLHKERQHSSVDFYPSLFALLISNSEYCFRPEGMKHRENGAVGTDDELPTATTTEYYRTQDYSKLSSPTHPLKIKALFDEIMLGPPWINDYRLWALRAMVCVWMADLEILGSGLGEDGEEVDNSEDDGYDTPDSMRSDTDEDDVERSRRKRRRTMGSEAHQTGSADGGDMATRKARRKELLKEARMCFNTATEKGGKVPPEVLPYL